MTEYVRLGDVCDFLGGFPFDSKKFTDDKKQTPLLRIRDVLRGYTTTYTSEEFDRKYLVSDGDMLIGMDGDFNIGIWRGGSALLNQRVCKVTCDDIKIDSRYVFFLLKTHLLKIWDKTTYSTVKHLSIKTLQNLTLPLPSLEEQKCIAAALDKMSSVIAKRKRQIALLDEAAKSLFVEMFGDPVENPMGWEVDVLNNLGEIISGITKGRKTTGKTLVDIPYMRVANVKDGHLDLSEIKLIGATAEEIMKYALQKGDVLLTEGGDNDKLGRGALWKGEIEPCIHQNHIFRVRAYPDKMFPKYFAEYLKSSQAKLYFLKSAKQTTGIASINMRQLSALPVVLPPLLLQERFVERIGKLEQQKISCERGLKQMETAFAAMMQEYFG